MLALLLWASDNNTVIVGVHVRAARLILWLEAKESMRKGAEAPQEPLRTILRDLRLSHKPSSSECPQYYSVEHSVG